MHRSPRFGEQYALGFQVEMIDGDRVERGSDEMPVGTAVGEALGKG